MINENTREGCFRERMTSALQQRGIDPGKFVKADPKSRLEMIQTNFGLKRDHADKKYETHYSNNTGLVIVKPEMHHASNLVESFLTQTLGTEISVATDFIYTPEEYWESHGQLLADYFDLFPHGSLLFLIAISAPSRLILFEHKPVEDYKRIFATLNGGEGNTLYEGDDPQAAFTQMFVRNSRNSLRASICQSETMDSGLLSLNSGVRQAVCWDFTNTFSQRSTEENNRTFNGVHSPRDRAELIVDLSILSRVE